MVSAQADPSSSTLRLTAPEILLLIEGPDIGLTLARRLIKVGILELLARQVLQFTETESSADIKAKRLRPGPAFEQALDRTLGGLREAYKELSKAESKAELTLVELIHAVVDKYYTYIGYGEKEVCAALVQRGFYRPEAYKILWVIPATRYVLTPAGHEAKSSLDSRITELRTQVSAPIQEVPDSVLQLAAESEPVYLLLLESSQADVDRALASEKAARAYEKGRERFGFKMALKLLEEHKELDSSADSAMGGDGNGNGGGDGGNGGNGG